LLNTHITYHVLVKYEKIKRREVGGFEPQTLSLPPHIPPQFQRLALTIITLIAHPNKIVKEVSFLGTDAPTPKPPS